MDRITQEKQKKEEKGKISKIERSKTAKEGLGRVRQTEQRQDDIVLRAEAVSSLLEQK